MRISNLLLILIVIANFSFQISFAQPPDVIGWNKSKWGMTEQEIIEAFNGQVQKVELTNTKYNLEIDNFNLVDKQFRVIFVIDENSNLLKSVIIKPNSNLDWSQKYTAFTRLEEDLNKKYGEPFNIKTEIKNGPYAEREWILPSTVITLKYWSNSKRNTSSVVLEYRERNR